MAFMIVGKDAPIYDLDLSHGHGSTRAGADAGTSVARTYQYIMHAALDMLEAAASATNATYLKVIDRHADQLVSGYITPGGVAFLLTSEPGGGKGEDATRAFFADVADLYARVLLNPFYTPYSRIESKDFDARVRLMARKHLGWRGE